MTTNFNNELKSAAAELITSLENILEEEKISAQVPRHELEGLCSRVRSAKTGYPFILTETTSQAIDRLGSVLLGPIYTNGNHPWPLNEDSSCTPMTPLCQLNTSHFPLEIEGLDGLIQIWLRSTDSSSDTAMIRIIPFSDANLEEMTPVISTDSNISSLLMGAADWLKDFHLPPRPSKHQFITTAAIKLGFADSDKFASSNWNEWTKTSEEYYEKYGDEAIGCFQITGFEAGSIYCDISVDQKAAIKDLKNLAKKLIKNKKELELSLIGKIEAVCTQLDNWIDLCENQSYPCLLGTFQEIQYQAVDMDEPLICFESIGLIEWGDGGNAQVFYSKKNGFKFNWSCT